MPHRGKPKGRVLVVDDEPAILAVFVRAFRREFEIVVAASAREALERLGEQQFDLLVLDFAMSEMNGLECAQQAAALQPGLVRVLVTAHYELADVRGALAQGVVADVIPKPWTPKELLARLLRALG